MRDQVPDRPGLSRLVRQDLAGRTGGTTEAEASAPTYADRTPLSVVCGMSLTPRFVLRAVLLADHMRKIYALNGSPQQPPAWEGRFDPSMNEKSARARFVERVMLENRDLAVANFG